MSVVPANYSVSAIANLVPAVDSDETRARTAQVETYGAIITSEDASVSVEAKMAAVNALRDLGASSRAMGAQDALMKASWYAAQSPFAKAMDAAGTKFSNEMMSAGRAIQARGEETPNGGQMNLDALSRRSLDEQKLIAYSMGFSSLESWKENLAQQARDYVAANPQPSVRVTLSDEAKAGLSRTAADADAALRPAGPTSVKGSAALAILENAAEARRARAEQQDADITPIEAGLAPKSETRLSYGIGETVDRVV